MSENHDIFIHSEAFMLIVLDDLLLKCNTFPRVRLIFDQSGTKNKLSNIIHIMYPGIMRLQLFCGRQSLERRE